MAELFRLEPLHWAHHFQEASVSTSQTDTPLPNSVASPDLLWENAAVVLKGIGQVFFQENALSGLLFVIGIAFGAPLEAVGGVVGSLIGLATARTLKFDEGETRAGIYGFNSALVGMATFFYFRPGLVSLLLLLVGCVVATLLTRWMRHSLPFPTYTTPFIVTTWGIYFLGRSLGAVHVDPGAPLRDVGVLSVIAHGIGQVMFQGTLWGGVFFLLGIAISNRTHAVWVLLGSVVGMLVSAYHATAGSDALHIERLLEHAHSDNIALGLYGYNATLTAAALYLWRKSVIPPLLGMILSVPVTELIPTLGLPALTAPFVLTTWLVMLLGWTEASLLKKSAASPS